MPLQLHAVRRAEKGLTQHWSIGQTYKHQQSLLASCMGLQSSRYRCGASLRTRKLSGRLEQVDSQLDTAHEAHMSQGHA